MLFNYSVRRITDALVSALRPATQIVPPRPLTTITTPLSIMALPATEALVEPRQRMVFLTRRDIIASGVSYAYAFSLIGLAEAVRHWRGYPHDFTRKIVHVGAGMWVFGVLSLFETWYMGVGVFGSFVPLNYIFYRYRLFRAMDKADGTPGTVYFALSISLLFLAFWRTQSPVDRAHIAAGGAMAMTWGDAMASLVGRRWGHHRYTVSNVTRSLEGSAAMLCASTLTIFLSLWFVPGSRLAPRALPLDGKTALTAAVLAALVATVAEALSPAGTDNLSVPLLAGLVIAAVTRRVPHSVTRSLNG